MPASPASAPVRPGAWRLLLPVLGAIGVAALWVLIALGLDRWLAGFALIAALDLVLMVRLARLPRGTRRGLIAAVGTALAIALAHWWQLGAQVGLVMGLAPWDGIPLMGGGFFWSLVRLVNQPTDLALYALALGLAGWFGR